MKRNKSGHDASCAFVHPPVNLVVPNTSAQKMEAIVNLSKAIAELSRALGSVHVVATISNNMISGAETGISVSLEKENP